MNMKNKLILVSAFVATLGTVLAQNNIPVLPQKQAGAETPDFTGAHANGITVTPVTPKGGPIWFNGFEDETEWTSAGPVGANPPEFGWSIRTTISSWYGGFQSNMNTTGSFAHFRNGTTTTAIEGPFTLTYNGTIDLTNVPVPHLEFDQYGARFITLQAVQISMDGNNWITVIDNNDIPPLTNAGGSVYPRPMFRRVNITPFLSGDISQVRVRLFWNGAMNGPNLNNIDYGWYVDNIRIVEGEQNDLALNRRFAYTMGQLGYMHTKIPVTQVPSGNNLKIEFKADVTNNGIATQNAFLRSTAGASYTADGTSKSIASLQSDSLFITGSAAFTVPSTAGTYNFTLTVLSNNELTNTSDDQATFPFEVTPENGGVMASDFFTGAASSMTGSFTGWANPNGDPSIGTWFEILNNTTPTRAIGAVDVGIANIQGTAQNNFIGNTLFAQIYRFVNGEFEFAGITEEYELKASDFGRIVRLYFKDNCINLNAGEDIAVMASFSEAAPVPIAFSGESLAGTTIGMNGSSFVSLAPTVTGGPYVRVPVVRPVFTCYLGLENETLSNGDVSIYPNPASDNTNVKLTLNGEEEVMITVRDLTGKTIQVLNAGKLTSGSHNVAMNLEGIAQGMYTITISAGTSSITQKMIVK
jgi:hypothetical protein